MDAIRYLEKNLQIPFVFCAKIFTSRGLSPSHLAPFPSHLFGLSRYGKKWWITTSEVTPKTLKKEKEAYWRC